MATFIDDSNVNENEQVLELARFINKLKNKNTSTEASTTPINEVYYEECVKLTEGNKHLEVLMKLLDEAQLFFTEAEKEVEGFFFVILSLSKKIGKEEFQKVIKRIVEIATSNPEEKSLLKIRILNNLYNIIGSESTDRYTIYLEILKIASITKNNEVVSSQITESNVDSKIAEWKLDQTKKRQVLKQIRDLFTSSRNTKNLFKWNVKFLSSFDGSLTNEETNEGFEEATKVIVEAIKLPDVFQLDNLLTIPIVKKMEGNAKYASVYQFLKIFAGETFESYKSFIEKNNNFISTHGLSEENCLRKIRLLSLATLASSNTEIQYSSIVKTLQINDNEVEIWVIAAISENLIDAKMDQLKRTVTISRSLQRTFTTENWKSILDGLNVWKGNVKVMLTTLNETKKLKPNQQHQALSKAIQQQN